MPRTSWTAWTIGEPFDQQVAGAPTGVFEKRCFITCPECNERINVSNALSHTQGLSSCRDDSILWIRSSETFVFLARQGTPA